MIKMINKIIKLIIPKSKHDLISRIFYSLKPTFIDEQTKSFIKHNKKIWKAYSKGEHKSEILFELTHMQSSIISYSYLANILANKHDAKIKAYSFRENKEVSLLHRKVYKSFNAEVFSYSLSQAQLIELEKLLNDVYSSLKTKTDVFKLTIADIWFGDLLYDSHLRTYRVPTVVINDHRFKDSLKKALYQYIYWRDYFNHHDVKAINATHCAYIIAIPVRIAIQRGIPAYQCNAQSCCYMTKERLWAYTDFYDFHRQFLELPEDVRRKGLIAAKERINRRFSGEIGVDMPYSTKSAYMNTREGRVLSESNKIKILIAPHCFFDSPNGIGVNLFPDFYEWLTFLGDISERTDYDWYLKLHPDFLSDNIAIFNEFINKYPKFTMIPANTSHHQIIKEGINYALTVYGTIGFEYAALGIPVINASLCNTHIAYNFNIHPKTIDEYESILTHLPDQKLDIDTNEVYEYYFMRFINSADNWLFDDYDKFLDKIGGYDKQFSPVSYKKFIEEFSDRKHRRLLCSLMNFIESKDHSLGNKHIHC